MAEWSKARGEKSPAQVTSIRIPLEPFEDNVYLLVSPGDALSIVISLAMLSVRHTYNRRY